VQNARDAHLEEHSRRAAAKLRARVGGLVVGG
jgi:hypothetical protein